MKRSISAMAAAAMCVAVCAGPAVARTARTSSATQLCSKVSASSVSSVIGYTVPAATGTTITAKATKSDDYISGTTVGCIFGTAKTMAQLKKTVTISFETVSKSLSLTEVKKLIDKTASLGALHVKISAYSGLSGESYLMSFSESGINVESLISAQGTKLYGATVYGSLASSKLASLVKLAEKL